MRYRVRLSRVVKLTNASTFYLQCDRISVDAILGNSGQPFCEGSYYETR